MELDVGYRDQDRPHADKKTDAAPGSANSGAAVAPSDLAAAEGSAAAAADSSFLHSNNEPGAPAAALSTTSAQHKLGRHILSQLPQAVQSRPLVVTYTATTVTALMFLAACQPMMHHCITTDHENSGLSRTLQSWSPLPQAALLLLLLALTAASHKRRAACADRDIVPPGVTVNKEGILCSEYTGTPLPRGLRVSRDGWKICAGPQETPLPKCCVLGPGGVLCHKATGRAIPHACGISDRGMLTSSEGQLLPDSMIVGPNSTLIAVDGTVLGPDLQPIPPGFNLSGCGNFLMRPNGKPVPWGVHVGPGFRLLKPTGEFLPDGVKIGPNGTIICPDGTILGTDGHPVPRGFVLSPDSTHILGPNGEPVDESDDMGPNGTLIGPQGQLLTAVGRLPVCQHYTLGPLGNLLYSSRPVPAAARILFVDNQIHLVMPDGVVQQCHQCHEAV